MTLGLTEADQRWQYPPARHKLRQQDKTTKRNSKHASKQRMKEAAAACSQSAACTHYARCAVLRCFVLCCASHHSLARPSRGQVDWSRVICPKHKHMSYQSQACTSQPSRAAGKNTSSSNKLQVHPVQGSTHTARGQDKQRESVISPCTERRVQAEA
jgi:hypothetical protein